MTNNGMTNDTENSSRTTLVLGGTGKTGRRIVHRLTARGVPTRVGSRAGDPPFDWTDESTWAPVLRGAGAAYVSFHPDLAVPGAADTVGALAARAVENGVRRLVLLSGRGEPEALRAEQAVRDAGAAWTIVRSSWFMQNFSESFLLDDVRSGVVALPVDQVPEPFVDADDVADVATAALTEEGHAGQVYEVTGPRLLRFTEAVSHIAHATGRRLRFQPVSLRDYAAQLGQWGVDPDLVGLMTYLFSEVLDGRNAHVTDGVRRALGRPPRDFADYTRAAAATGVWDRPTAA